MNRRIWSYLAATAALLAPLAAAAPAVAAPSGPRLLVAAADSVVTQPGQQFYSHDFYVTRASDRILVSGTSDGTGDFYVDDLLDLEVTRPDGSVVRRQVDDSNGCTADTVLTAKPVNIAPLLQWGVNKLRVTFRDACGGDFGNSDIWLSGADVAEADPTLPAMDGGTLIHVYHLKRGQGMEECTSGFTVKANGRLYMTTAKHCFAGVDNPTETNAYVADTMPVSVRTADRLGRSGFDKFTFAQQLSCLAGTTACLLPPNRYRPSADMLAFAPDTAVPTSRVQTGRGLLPVLGETTPAALRGTIPAPQVCHYGLGSLRDRGRAEQCGTLTTATDRGLTWLSAPASGGDSGGPVYVYAPGGAGVYALGLAVTAKTTCNRLGRNCDVDTGFVPMTAVESALAARLWTQA